MKRILFFLLIFICHYGNAQLVRVDGTLSIANLDGKIGQMTVFGLPDSNLIKGAYIDSSYFSFFMNKGKGQDFYAKIKLYGYQDTSINFSVTDTVVHLGIVQLEQDLQLNTVEVLYREPAFERTMDGIKVNVDGTTLQTLDNLFEILKASPKLTSPDDESIEIIGKGVPLILIDRQPILTSDELRAIPADMVESIEIITNPSAKYRAQGRGNGVIEVYTKNFRLQGYNMNISANGGVNTQLKPTGRLGLGYSLKKGKFSMNGYLSGNVNTRYAYGSSDQITIGDDSLITSSAWNDEGLNSWQHMNLKAAYQVNDFHRITAGIRGGGSISQSTSTNEKVYYQNTELLTERIQTGKNGWTWWNTSSFVNYLWETDTNKSNLEVNLNYQLRINESSNEYYNQFEDVLNNSFSDFDVKNDSRNRPNIGELRVTYEHIFDTTGWTLSGGGSFSLVYNRKRFNQFNYDDEMWVEDPQFTNSYNYSEQIGNAFIEVTKNWDKFSVRAGLTAEYTKLDGYSNSLNQQFMDSTYLLPFPSLSLMYQPSEKVSMTLRYSSGIDRPAFSNYDPFVRIQDSLNIEYGNPFLRPSTEHNFGFDLDLFYMYGISFDYSYSEGFESNLSFIDSNFLMNSTPWNGDAIHSYSGSLNLPIQTKWLSGWNSIWVNYNLYSFTPIFEREDFSNFTYGLWSYLNFHLAGNWNITNRLHVARWGSEQYVNRINMNWGIRVTKKLMDNKLSIWGEVANIFPPVYRSSTYASNYSGNSVSYSQFTTFKAGIFFKWGRLKQDTNIKESKSGQSNRL